MEKTIGRAWYAIQTYSGMEAAAKRNIEQRIKTMRMEDYIFQVFLPEVHHTEKKKNGEDKDVVERIYPGYLFIDMIVTDDSWFVIRNTPMVSGFLGSSGGGAKPVPIDESEIIPILKQCGQEVIIECKFKIGDTVDIVAGSFEGQQGTVESIDIENQIVTVLVDFFGRQTPQELNFEEVEPTE